MSEIEFFEVMGVFGEGEHFGLDIVGGLLGECFCEEFGIDENIFGV